MEKENNNPSGKNGKTKELLAMRKSQLTNLSKRSAEENTKRVLRINQNNPAHALAPRSDKNPAKYVRGGAVLMPKLPGQAMPPSDDLFRRPAYVPGDGERMQATRPGSEDFLNIKSVGNSV